jgi:hypothetical protein
MRLCTKCHLNETLKYWCNSCMYQAKKNWVKRNKTRVSFLQKRRRKLNPLSFTLIKRRNALKKYGLTIESFNQMLIDQNSLCKICKTDKPGGFANQWTVDHCHTTGLVRGILCTNCNKGLGYFKDSPELFDIARKYLLTND